MRVVETTIFTFDELSDEAKAYARKALVEQPDYPYDEWWSFEDFVTCASLLGIEIDNRALSNTNGSRWNVPRIDFQLHTQGSGASFVGHYRSKPDAMVAIAEHAPQDKELARIAEELTALQVTCMLEHGDQLEAEITTTGGLSVHSMSMNVNVLATGPYSDDVEPNEERAITQLMRDFSDWMYRELQTQYDWHFTNERIDEELAEKEFLESGVAA